jgi:hypothetical protein
MLLSKLLILLWFIDISKMEMVEKVRKLLFLKKYIQLSVVVYASNPSYSGGGDQEIKVQGCPEAK